LALGTPWTIITFLIGLVISTIIIFIVTRLFGERESVKIAFITAVIGAVIYTVIYYLLGNGLVAAIVGGIVWLISLKWLYKMGWLKSILVAVIIWIIVVLLPTASGPL
jgi:L-lactate permease